MNDPQNDIILSEILEAVHSLTNLTKQIVESQTNCEKRFASEMAKYEEDRTAWLDSQKQLDAMKAKWDEHNASWVAALAKWQTRKTDPARVLLLVLAVVAIVLTVAQFVVMLSPARNP